jgi:hypothetical protein
VGTDFRQNFDPQKIKCTRFVKDKYNENGERLHQGFPTMAIVYSKTIEMANSSKSGAQN